MVDYSKPYGAPCVRSGFCCKKAPCPYGEWNAEKTQCKELVGDRPGEYACGIIDRIKTYPGWEIVPAFGGGCSSTLFNPDRDAVLRRARLKGDPMKTEFLPPVIQRHAYRRARGSKVLLTLPAGDLEQTLNASLGLEESTPLNHTVYEVSGEGGKSLYLWFSDGRLLVCEGIQILVPEKEG